jgi:hypothetical protein
MTVNKSDDLGVSAALNVYPKGQNFSGNFALRFDLFLVENSAGTAQSKVENVLFGINHSGTHTNWFRNAVSGTDLPGSPTASDGLFFDIGADGNGGGGAPYDFAAWSAPTYTNNVGVIGPTNFLARLATSTRQIFKKPPFDGGTAFGGDPANTIVNLTPTWVQVDVRQVGKLITWKVNNTVMLQFVNTNGLAALATSGTVMLGYCDPWDDIGNSSANSGEGCAVIDNVRVVTISAPVVITNPSNIVAVAGTATNLSVVVSTITGVTNYQWTYNGTNIAGATSSTLNFAALGVTNYGTYTVTVDDGAYQSTSAAATVLPPVPSVTTPAGKAVPFGLVSTLTVTGTTYSGQTNYQWQLNGANVSGANFTGGTSNTLTITSMKAATAGAYTAIVNDGFNSVTSGVANVTLAVQPKITTTVGGGNLTLNFPTEIGPSYVVEWKGALTNGAWNQLVTNPGSGSPVSVPTSIGPDSRRFYRVRMQ